MDKKFAEYFLPYIYLHDGTEILSLICATRALNMLLNGEIIIFVEAIYACTNVKGTFKVITKISHHFFGCTLVNAVDD